MNNLQEIMDNKEVKIILKNNNLIFFFHIGREWLFNSCPRKRNSRENIINF